VKAVYKARREPGAIEVREVAPPSSGPEDLLVRVQAGSICGSDVHVYKYSRGFEYIQPPFILGHEFTGVVEQVGERVQGFIPGDRVISEGVHYCGQCRPCRMGQTNRCRNFRIIGLHFDGGFADYASFNARYAHKIPSKLPPEQAALVEPASVCVHAVRQGPRLEPSDVVLVTGVGPIGIMVAQLAKLAGAARVLVTGVDGDEEFRMPVARSLGLEVVNVEREDPTQMLKDLTDGYGPDLVFECSGAKSALLQGMDLVRKGGHMVIVGIQSSPAEVYFTPYIRREITFHTAITSIWRDFEAAIDLMARGDLKVQPLVTTFPMASPTEAIEGSLNRQVLKAVLIPATPVNSAGRRGS